MPVDNALWFCSGRKSFLRMRFLRYAIMGIASHDLLPESEVVVIRVTSSQFRGGRGGTRARRERAERESFGFPLTTCHLLPPAAKSGCRNGKANR